MGKNRALFCLAAGGGGGGEGARVAFVKRGLGNRALFFHLQQGQIKVTLTVTGSFASTPSLIAPWHNCFFACRKSVTSEQREQAREMKKKWYVLCIQTTHCPFHTSDGERNSAYETEELNLRPRL